MRYHFFLHYGWFFQNLGKEGRRTFMHTTVCPFKIDISWKGGNNFLITNFQHILQPFLVTIMALLELHGARLFVTVQLIITTRNLSMSGVTLMQKLGMSLLMKLGTILVWTMTFQLLTRLQDVTERVSWAMGIHQTSGLNAASRICKLITSLTKTIGAWTVSIKNN